MPEELVTEGAQLSQVSRTVNTFVAPSKTFTDILRSANCWLPLVLIVLVTFGWSYSVDKKVGFHAAVEQQIAHSPKQAEQMQSMEPAARTKALEMRTIGTKFFSYGSFLVVFIFMAFETLVLWGSFNFGLGANTTFPKVFAVVAFAGLPRMMMFVLSAILLFAGVGTESFDMQNPVGTNIGYYLSDSAAWLQTLGKFFDVFGLWSLALLIIGMAIISRKTIAQSATVILGWFVLILIIAVGATAAFS